MLVKNMSLYETAHFRVKGLVSKREAQGEKCPSFPRKGPATPTLPLSRMDCGPVSLVGHTFFQVVSFPKGAQIAENL